MNPLCSSEKPKSSFLLKGIYPEVEVFTIESGTGTIVKLRMGKRFWETRYFVDPEELEQWMSIVGGQNNLLSKIFREEKTVEGRKILWEWYLANRNHFYCPHGWFNIHTTVQKNFGLAKSMGLKMKPLTPSSLVSTKYTSPVSLWSAETESTNEIFVVQVDTENNTFFWYTNKGFADKETPYTQQGAPRMLVEVNENYDALLGLITRKHKCLESSTVDRAVKSLVSERVWDQLYFQRQTLR